MGLPFFNSTATKRRDQMLALDLGARFTKAVHLERQGDSYALCGYALLDAPISEKTPSAELLSEHLKQVSQALPTRNRLVTLTLSPNETLLRPVEMPRMPMDETRLVLKHNCRAYLQQELNNHVFDCHPLPQRSDPKSGSGGLKQKLLVTSAKNEVVERFAQGAKNAGLVADCIVPSIIGPVNAFEIAMPEVFKSECVALVDIGFRSSTICLLQEGELILTRIVAIGGDVLTQGVSESLNVSYAEAEGIKVGMPLEVQSALEGHAAPLGRELRASIDFFEHQQDRVVSQVFVCGASTRSEVILQVLQAQLMVECKVWNPTTPLKMNLPANQAAEIEQVAPQLAVAIGAALAAL
jgi:type IV pilus assembly protein PilM